MLAFISLSTTLLIRKVAVENAARQTLDQFYLIKNFVDTLIGNSSKELNILSQNINFKIFIKYMNSDIIHYDFIQIMLRHSEFFQLRFLDESGMERARINRKRNKLEWVSKEKLQDKSNYYYFKEIKALKKGEIYISNLDLNVEHNKIEIPHRLVARVGMPVYENDRFQGCLIINIDGSYILSKIIPNQRHINNRAFLINDKGLSISAENGKFIVKDSLIFKKKFNLGISNLLVDKPVLFKKVQNGFISILPLKFNTSSVVHKWWVVLFDSNELVFQSFYKSMNTMFLLLTLIILFIFAVSWFVTSKFSRPIESIIKYIPFAKDKKFDNTGIEEFDNIAEAIHLTSKELNNLNYTLEQRIKEQVKKIEELASEKIEYQEKLKNIQNQLLQADRLASLGLISATVAHELGNPLAAIKTSLQVIKAENICSDDEYMDKVIVQVDRLTSFLKNITNYSGTTKDDKKYIELVRVLNDVIEILGSELKKKKIEIILNNTSDKKILLDEISIQQVFFNLIQNSYEELDEEGKIFINMYDKSDTTWVEFEDTAGGSKNIDEIFEPFYTTKKEGTGLGLAIVKSIAKKYDWTLKVQNGYYGLKISIGVKYE
jgi:signal transduction histidine kinase